MSEINDIIKIKLQNLIDCGIDVSLFELKLLMADALNTDVGNLRFYNEQPTKKQIDKFEKFIEMKKIFGLSIKY